MSGVGSLVSVGRNWTEAPKELDVDFGDELRVTCFHDPPYTFVTQHANGSLSFDGYLFELWLLVADMLQLRYRMVPASNQGYGILGEEGIWNGMVGELVYGRADVALTWLLYTRNRATAIDYLDAVSMSESALAFYTYRDLEEMPSPSADMFNSLLRPLHGDVWWTLFATLLVISVVLRVSVRFNHERAEDRRNVAELGWRSCLLSGFRTVMGQGWHTVPSSLAARIVTIFTWLLAIIISTSYTANLISYLTVVKQEPPLASIRDFIERPDWRLAIAPSYIIVDEWRTSKDEYERRLYDIVRTKDRLISLEPAEENAQFATQPKVLTYVELESLAPTLGRDVCSLVLLPKFPKQKLGTYLVMAQNKDGVKQQLNDALSKAQEAGIISRLQKKWLTGVPCEAPDAFKPLSFGNLIALMAIIPLGVIVSTALLAGEKIWGILRGRKLRVKRHNEYFPPLTKSSNV